MDVGTGYYVEKSTKDAEKFYQSKVDGLGKSLADLEKIIAQKSQNVRIVEDGRCTLAIHKDACLTSCSSTSKGCRSAKRPGILSV